MYHVAKIGYDITFQSQNLKGRDYVGDLGIGEEIR
jgi:hypothetical protein